MSGDKRRVMSLWWLVIVEEYVGHPSYHRRGEGPHHKGGGYSGLLEAALFTESEAAHVAAGNSEARVVNAAVHIRSLDLPKASTVTVLGVQGAIMGSHEELGPVRTMVDMLEGSTMAAALRGGE